MKFFVHDIIDHELKTRHLTPMEDIIYRRLVDLYYKTDGAVSSNLGNTIRLIAMSGFELEFKRIVDEFFYISCDGLKLCNDEIDSKINAYYVKRENRSNAAKAGILKKVIQKNNNNILERKKENIKRKKESNDTIKPDSVSVNTWRDFLIHRQKKKAPVTETAMRMIIRESEKAGMEIETVLLEMINRGWCGFKADWIKTRPHDIKSINYGENGKI